MRAPRQTNSELGEADPPARKPVTAAWSREPVKQGWNCHACRHPWDEPVETSAESRPCSPVDTIGGLVFMVEFAVCGVGRMEGVAGHGVKRGLKSTAR